MRTIVITGATSGIGLETARLLARQGFRVLGIGRCQERCAQAKASLLAENPGAGSTYFCCDLLRQREVIRVAKEITADVDRAGEGELYALINNAGCARNWYMTTEEGYEQQFALNYLAGFLLTQQLLPLLQKAKGRVIMTGSKSHKGARVHWDDVMLRRGYHPLAAYKQSKLCNMLFAKGLNDRYAALGLHAYVVDPGLVNTDIGNKDTGGLTDLVWTLRKGYGVSPAVPAETYLFLCTQETPPQGLYYHLCREKPYSKQVTGKNADRLFALSQRLSGVTYDQECVR